MLAEQSMPLLQEARFAITREPSSHSAVQYSQRMSCYPGMGHLPDVSTMTRTQLQDYQMQLMLLRQQNKKRLLMLAKNRTACLRNRKNINSMKIRINRCSWSNTTRTDWCKSKRRGRHKIWRRKESIKEGKKKTHYAHTIHRRFMSNNRMKSANGTWR